MEFGFNEAKTRNPLKFAGVPQTRRHASAGNEQHSSMGDSEQPYAECVEKQRDRISKFQTENSSNTAATSVRHIA